MSSLLNLVARYSYPTLRILQPAVFFSSTVTLFREDAHEIKTQGIAKVKAKLREAGFNYLNETGSDFNKDDLKPLKVSFQSASKCEVLPCNIDLKDNLVTDFLKKYSLPGIDVQDPAYREFDAGKFKEIDDDVKTFLTAIYETNSLNCAIGTLESVTDKMLINLLVQVLNMHKYPLNFSIKPLCDLFIADVPYVMATPEFVFNRNDISMIVVEDRYLGDSCLGYLKGFGETQLAAEMLAYVSDNTRSVKIVSDQIVFGVRIISTCFTFYKTVIPANYLYELDIKLPQVQSVVIKRWPEGEHPGNGLDISEPNERQEVLEAFARIRQFLLQ